MIVKPDPGLPESQIPDSISIVVSLDAAHSMIALPVEAPLSHVRDDYGVAGTEDAPGGPRGYEEWDYAARAWYL